MKAMMVMAILAALSLPGYCFQSPQAGAGGENGELKALPPISLQDFTGKRVSTDPFKGKVVVLDFWATWCVPCIAEIPTLNMLQEKYGRQGLEVVGVTMASGAPREVKPIVTKNGMKYAVLMGDDDQAYDFGIVAFPTTFLLTKDLKIYKKFIGVTPWKSTQLEADIKKLLEGNAKRE